MDSQYYMHECLKLAKDALESGNPPVGAIIVLNNKIIGKGIESGKTSGDITNHAEILSIRDAVKNGYSDQLHLASMYTTHEPCIMCSYMIRHHKITEIIYGTSVTFVGGYTSKFNILDTEDVPKWGIKPKISSGILEKECNELTTAFLKRQEKLK